jgi:hypothetical protein
MRVSAGAFRSGSYGYCSTCVPPELAEALEEFKLHDDTDDDESGNWDNAVRSLEDAG